MGLVETLKSYLTASAIVLFTSIIIIFPVVPIVVNILTVAFCDLFIFIKIMFIHFGQFCFLLFKNMDICKCSCFCCFVFICSKETQFKV